MVVALLLSLLVMVPGAEIAPPPRLKVDTACKPCDDGDARCRARAALALHSASVSIVVPKVMPSAQRMAAKAALERADKAIKATPKRDSPIER